VSEAIGVVNTEETERLGVSEWQPVWRNNDELVRFADLTLAELFRQNARYGRGSRLLEEDGLVLFAGSHPQPNPYRNGAFRLDQRLGAGPALDQASQFFATLERPFVFWVSERDADLAELCAARGFELLEPDGLPELALATPPPPVRPLADDVVLLRADTPEVRRDYVAVVAEGWGMGDISTDLASEIFFHPDSVADPNAIAFVAYVDGRPASGCLALLAYGIAVGGQGATVRWARRRGLAEACYEACLEVAYNEFGIRGSVCQSSPLGQGVWERMGYRELTSYLRYLVPPQARSWG
jgi:hypothetical protein